MILSLLVGLAVVLPAAMITLALLALVGGLVAGLAEEAPGAGLVRPRL
jgi:uncharacterized membrane-anchored protein